MAQQTAVEYLIQEIKNDVFVNSKSTKEWNEIFKQAKAMEKEQIQKAFSDGQETPLNHSTLPHYSSEEYYNNTFKTN